MSLHFVWSPYVTNKLEIKLPNLIWLLTVSSPSLFFVPCVCLLHLSSLDPFTLFSLYPQSFFLPVLSPSSFWKISICFAYLNHANYLDVSDLQRFIKLYAIPHLFLLKFFSYTLLFNYTLQKRNFLSQITHPSSYPFNEKLP